MVINPEYVAKLKEFCQTPQAISQGLHFGFLMTFREEFPDLNNYFLDGEQSVIPYEEFQLFNINLVKVNATTGKKELVVDLFSHSNSGEFDQFLNLLSNYHIESTGHLNNRLAYSIFGPDDKKAYESIKQRIGAEFKIENLAISVSNYYEVTQFAKKLTKYFLDGDAYQDYKKYL